MRKLEIDFVYNMRPSDRTQQLSTAKYGQVLYLYKILVCYLYANLTLKVSNFPITLRAEFFCNSCRSLLYDVAQASFSSREYSPFKLYGGFSSREHSIDLLN